MIYLTIQYWLIDFFFFNFTFFGSLLAVVNLFSKFLVSMDPIYHLYRKFEMIP